MLRKIKEQAARTSVFQKRKLSPALALVSFIKGSPPSVAVEFGRRAIPGNVRPSFQELAKYIKDKSGEAPAAAS